MPCFYIVVKLLMLKFLLANIAGLNAYEFGYHPSAEEFDSLMRDTRKTWTHELLANARRRSWTAESKRDFVPKYNYESARNRRVGPGVMHTWPGYVEKIEKPAAIQHHRHDQQTASATHVMMGGNVGSSLDFTLFSDEVDMPVVAEEFGVHKQPANQFHSGAVVADAGGDAGDNNKNVFSSVSIGPAIAAAKPVLQQQIHNSMPSPQQTLNAVIEIDSSSSESHQSPVSHQKYSHNNVNKNSSGEEHFPIFFTNPATGIVYAITQVGRVQGNTTQKNDTIPIYITKEQYERDMYLLRKDYEHKCYIAASANKEHQNVSSPSDVISAISTSIINTTMRPHIIRRQRPALTVSKMPVSKLPITNIHKPPPVVVQTEVTVRDQVKLPSNRRKNNKNKIKKKKKKSKNKKPGRRPQGVSVANKPIILTAATTQFPLPHIVRGTKAGATLRPSTSTNKLATQLEKPSPTVPITAFSDRPLMATSGNMSPITKKTRGPFSTLQNHRMKRSVTTARDELLKTAPFHDVVSISKNTWEPQIRAVESFTDSMAKSQHRVPKLPGSRKKNTHSRNHTALAKVLVSRSNHTSGTRSNNYGKNTTLTNVSKSITTTSQPGLHIVEQNGTVQGASTINVLTTERSWEKSSRDKQKSQARRNDHQKSKKHKRKSDDADFDIFDMIDGDDSDDEESSYYDDDDGHNSPVYKVVKSVLNKKAKRKESAESDADLLEDVEQGNSSSAEEGADFGALEEEEEKYQQHDDNTSEDVSSNTKNTSGKKRIRRRPAAISYEDFSADVDYDDDESDGGIGGFFRMIFYPVQMIMSKVLDTLGGEKDVADDQGPSYPTYTQYNSAIRPSESAEEEAQSNFLGDWIGSWFSFNRKTKKIGSSTTAPPLPIVRPTNQKAGWLESWFGLSGPSTTEASYEEYDDDDKWLFGWFDTKPKAKRRATTTTATTTGTTAPTPQVPILTIVDPLRNPQNWIGILAHHIVNSTSTSTHNPLIEAITRATATSTSTIDNPDIPRRVPYDNYQIWRLKPQDEAQVKALSELQQSEEGVKLQWLKGPSLRGLTDVLVPPKMLIDFGGSLNFEAIAHEVLIFDVGKAIAYERSKEDYFFTTTERPNKHAHKKIVQQPPMSWHKYYAYDDIVKYLESIRMRHPQIVELIHIGRSFEGRPLIIAKLELKRAADAAASYAQVSHNKLKYKRKSGHANAVFIESGTHGLEWIGPATSTWIISELLRIMKNNKSDPETEFIKKTIWYVMPVLNPDGYVFSHEYDRFWKKSRSRHVSRPDDLISSAMSWLQQKKAREKVCYGVDLDRNWHYQWGRRGSSKAPCNELFAGPAPFSEPETKALSEFLMDYRKQIKLYISMQSYGQIISYPLRANVSFNSERMDDFLDVAMVGTDGLRKKGSKSRYKVDSTSDLIENRSGCSDAFAAYEVGIPFSYTMQLADSGVHGYLLPSSSIEPTARDAFEVITAMLDYI